MSSITLSSLRLATALFLLFASGRLSTVASLYIYQVEIIQDGPDDTFLVEGFATITIGGSAPRHFAFNCISTITNGEDISWARADGGDSFSQHLIPNGVQLDLANAQASDLTVYICYDGATSASVKINVTDANPVASPVEEDGVIEAFLGEEVVIEFYAAGLPPPSPDDISWFYNFSPSITWGILSDDKRSLTIPNIQLSHAGEYKFRVLVWTFASVTQSTTATATVKVIAKIQLEYQPEDGPAEEVSNLHFINGNNNIPFFINCFGSEKLWWTSPTGDNVSLVPSDNPNQQTTDTLSRTLSFQSWSEELNGLYTCSSGLDGASESITITNSNPAVVAEDVNVRVALNQNATLRVYVAGDPQPGADDIEWYKNGMAIVTTSSYSFMSDRQSLMIVVTGKDAAGIYECRVNTSVGTSSAFINVTVPDPPEVIVIPPVSDVLVGNSSSFTCNVTSSLEYTLSWYFNDSPQLPEGVMAEDNVLVIPSAQPSHFGTYTCQADDQVNVRSSQAMLVVNYSPGVLVGLTEQDKGPEFFHTTNEGEIPPSFSCFYSGYPSPDVAWTLYSGKPLPSSMKQIHAKPGVLQLQFTSALADDDPISFVCSASNSLGTATAKLELVIIDPESLWFQLKGGEFSSCTGWDSSTESSIDMLIRMEVGQVIRDGCQCNFQENFISQAVLLCDPQDPNQIVYRAKITTYESYSANQLVGYIEDWVNQGATITSGIFKVTFDSDCPVRVSDISDPVCAQPLTSATSSTSATSPTSTPSKSKTPAVFAVGVSVAVILVAVTIVMIILLMRIICVLKQNKKSQEIELKQCSAFGQVKQVHETGS